MTKVEKTFPILLYYYYYYDYDFIIINSHYHLSIPFAKTTLGFNFFGINFLMRTESISNNCHFSFTLQTLATLNV